MLKTKLFWCDAIIVRDLVMEWELSSSFSLLRKMLRKEKSYECNLGRHKVGETHYFYYNFISENIQSSIFKQSSFRKHLDNYQCLFPNLYLQSPVRVQDCVSPWTAQVTGAGVREHRSWWDDNLMSVWSSLSQETSCSPQWGITTPLCTTRHWPALSGLTGTAFKVELVSSSGSGRT